jgi:hypothetical protein
VVKWLQAGYCTNTAARQGCHQQSAVLAARESCSFVNAARVDIIGLRVHNWLHRIKVRSVLRGMAVATCCLKKLASATFLPRLFLCKQALIFAKRMD